ncbi:MAG TPA: hypothetical protein PKE63_09370 [Lacibacter sp.]|nr:hypothetical protein [Lacibacter sp.]HMO88358.1 hypothetical protein [Lacibacter sp.]HMP87474.1 hypothetical protein [Lacibacter sp.]
MFLNDDFRDFIHALNQGGVSYILVGGYAVILRGYSRSTGDLDIWVEKTPENYKKLLRAFQLFGAPAGAVPADQFFSDAYDVFALGVPPYAIEIMTQVKGLDFRETYRKATMETMDETPVRVIHLHHLLQAKKAAGRYKDLNDIENLPREEEDQV